MVRHARMQGHPTLWLPGLDHASIAAQFVLDRIIAEEGESRAIARSRAVSRADAAVHRRDREVMLGQQRRVGGIARLEPAPVHDGRGLGARRACRASSASIDDGLAYRTEALINWCPGCRTSVSRPRGHPDARDRARSGRSATTSSTRRPAQPDPERLDRRRDDAARDDPRRHGGRRPSRRRPLPRRSSAGGCGSRSWSATSRSSPTTVVDRGVRDRRGEDHAGPRPRRLRDRASATTCR